MQPISKVKWLRGKFRKGIKMVNRNNAFTTGKNYKFVIVEANGHYEV